MTTAERNGHQESPFKEQLREWRRKALQSLPLDSVYGDILTRKQQGPGWLEARDPWSPTGDRNPSAGVADGTGEAERGAFKSFRDGDRPISVFDYLVKSGKATDFRDARAIMARLSGVPRPERGPRATMGSGSFAGQANDAASDGEKKTPGRAAYKFDVIDSRIFAHANYRIHWLIRWLIISGLPVLIGGPRKTLKTSIIIDLVLSLGSGMPFLGCEEFRVYRKLTVAILSGESGGFTLQETARRVCKAKGIDLAEVSVYWGFTLPQLANPIDVAALARGLKDKKIEVLVIDPAYLCLLAGVEGKDINAANLFEVGPLLMSVGRACLDAGCTPILIHHTRKNLQAPFEPLELEDLAFAGFQEWARQWLLVNRREKYEPGTGEHRLWLTAGGSAGQGGQWALDITEGQLREDFGGRVWEVSVNGAREVRQAATTEKQARQEKDEASRLLKAVDDLAAKAGDRFAIVGYTEARDLAHLSSTKVTPCRASPGDRKTPGAGRPHQECGTAKLCAAGGEGASQALLRR